MQEQETLSEREELDFFLQSPIYQDEIQQALLAAFYVDKPLSDLTDVKQEQILTAIQQLEPIPARRPIRRRMLFWSAVAACLLLFLTPLLFRKQQSESNVVQLTQQKVDWSSAGTNGKIKKISSIWHDPKPAAKKAVLTLSDGFRVNIESLSMGEAVKHAGLKIEKLQSGDLAIVLENNAADFDQNKLNSLSTPKGGWYWIVLGDGTKVQLNASSTLKFPSRFKGNKREVYLEGEAFFEVHEDKSSQFIVNSGKGNLKQQVAVYGTVFNVMAYPEKSHAITTLLSGSVKIINLNSRKGSFLQPDQQAVVSSKGVAISPANLTENLAWKNNLFYFADTPIEEVMLEVSRWYDVNIHYTIALPKIKIWGQMTREKTLSEVLDILAKTNGIRFDIKGKEVMVSMK